MTRYDMYVHTYITIYHSVEDEPASCWHGPTVHAASSEGRRRLPLARISAMLAMAGLLSRLPASFGLGKKAAVSASIPPSPERAQR